jgi:hypothetical protein
LSREREALVAQGLAIAGVALGLLGRFLARPRAPLWVDETFTGAIVSQPTFARFLHLAYLEVSSPLYFLVMRPWQAVFGISDTALRTPSLIFGILTPLPIVLVRIGGLTLTERLVWAALVALWIPGVGFAQDARCYAFVLFLATIQTLAFARLMQRPALILAALWVVSADLTIAAHYDAAWLALAQGLIFLAVNRRQALKTWPAALLGIPILVVIGWQGPEMARYMRADVAWYGVPPISALPSVIAYFLGAPGYLIGLPAFALGFWFVGRRSPPPAPIPGGQDLAWTAAAALLGASALIAIGFVSPTLTWRYLAPFEPGLMLGVVLLLSALARDARQMAMIGLAIAAITTNGRWLAAGAHHDDSVQEAFNYEIASENLMHQGARRVVFAWDNPNVWLMHEDQLAQYGGFFFRRARAGVTVIPVRVSKANDPNRVILAAARANRAAILWVFSNGVLNTAATAFPPRISVIDPSWQCRQFGQADVGALVCMTAGAAAP